MKCSTCGRRLVSWQAAEPDDPAMDCGGDCLECVRKTDRNVTVLDRAASSVLAAQMASASTDAERDRLRRQFSEALRREAREFSDYIAKRSFRRPN